MLCTSGFLCAALIAGILLGQSAQTTDAVASYNEAAFLADVNTLSKEELLACYGSDTPYGSTLPPLSLPTKSPANDTSHQLDSSLPIAKHITASPAKPSDVIDLTPSIPSSSSVPSVIIPSSSSSTIPASGTLTIKTSQGEIFTGDSVTVVSMVVQAEMGPSFHPEALKAQAVATHTMILVKNALGQTPTCPTRDPAPEVIAAVSAVDTQLLYYQEDLMQQVVYHANAGGHTQSSKYVWGGDIPYLAAVESKYDDTENAPYVISVEDLRIRIQNATGGILDSNPAQWLEVLSTTDGGFADQMRVGDQIITGRAFRESVLGYALRSCKITKIDLLKDNFYITTKGYGHGVGMSQVGANGYAINENFSYQQILSHYYSGAVVR